MKQLIKLAITALVTYSAWHAGHAWLTYSQFKDEVEHLAVSGTRLTDDQLQEQVLEAASQRALLLHDDVAVRREGDYTYVDASYTSPINLLPGYTYLWTFDVHVNALTLRGSLK
jgi:hypothetical protein